MLIIKMYVCITSENWKNCSWNWRYYFSRLLAIVPHSNLHCQ